MLTKRSLIVLILALAVSGPSRAVETQALHVLDGDTFVLDGQKVRIFGIDAPEKRQRCDASGRNWACGEWSAAKLTDLTAADLVACDFVEWDKYRRAISVCFAGGQDLGAAMVRAGAAAAYIKYSRRYVAQERLAKSDARGMWNGPTVTPERFRHPVQQKASPKSCAIKGNVSARGERIYHMPGQKYYAKTRINPAKGEAYFCTEAEARAAGFRKAKT